MVYQKIKKTTERTPEVNELLNTEPPWMIRWGTTLIFLLLIIAAVAVFLYLDSEKSITAEKFQTDPSILEIPVSMKT